MNVPVINVRKGDWIQTHSGKQFWPLDPAAAEINIDDIAHALSQLCRFGGHCRTFYSVAEHSVILSEYAPREFKKWALLHDASEAYLVDVPRPIKRYLGGYEEIEDGLMKRIAEKFDLKWPMPPEVKDIDNRILLTEQKALMKAPPADWAIRGEPLPVKIQAVTPPVARAWFLEQWESVR